MNKVRVMDRQVFLAEEKLSPRMSITPEGYLICHDVPIARTGHQLYAEDEINMPGDEQLVGENGVIIAERTEQEVFRPETIASFEGKPVTIDHPDDFVRPDNWRELTVGSVNNVHRGEGTQSDLLIADLLITDQSGIDTIQIEGIRQVSCGYDTKYEQLAPGHAAQRDIVGNHVAIVARGRAGERCSIGDNMSKKLTWMDKLRHFVKDNAEEIVGEEKEKKEATDEGEEEQFGARLADIESAISNLQSKVDKIASSLDSHPEEPDMVMDEEIEVVAASEDPAEEVVEVTAAKDSMRNVLARAEIIHPGFRPHTHDGVKITAKAVKVQALSAAYRTADGARIINKLLGGSPANFSKMSLDGLNVLFNSTSEAVKEKNNAGHFSEISKYQSRDTKGMSTIRSMNEAAAKLRS